MSVQVTGLTDWQFFSPTVTGVGRLVQEVKAAGFKIAVLAI